MGFLNFIWSALKAKSKYKVLYKLNSSSAWATAYEGNTETTAFEYADRERTKGRFAVRIIGPDGGTLYSK